MKINATLLAAALGLTSASLASAQQYAFLTGSTAARDAVYNTVMNGTQGGFDSTPAFIGYGSTVPGNCSYMEFYGTVGGNATILTCHWSGSEAGISDVSGTATETFAEDATSAFPAPGTANAIATKSAPATTVNHTVDFAQADNNLTYSYTPTSTATAVDDSCVIPFVFVKTTTTLSDQSLLTDINYDNFKALASGGQPLSLFSGNPADTTYVYLSGRDHFSGTRCNTFGDTTFGIKTSPNQIIMDGFGNMVDQGGGVYYTSEGQASGGTLANTMTNTTTRVDQIQSQLLGTTVTGFITVAYLGLADDVTAESVSGATRLTYCGVPYSVANVQNGTYKFWGYEYTMKRSGLSGYANTMATAIAANIKNNTTGFEISKSTMHVKRTGPTAYVHY